jgi:predicted small secreted protein
VHKTSELRRLALSVLSVALLSLSVAACGGSDNAGKDVKALDEKLAGKGSDPAMNAALEDKILVDPALADSSNSNMVKAPDAPLDGSVPPDTGYEGAIASAEDLNNVKLMRAPKPTVVAAGDCRDCKANGGPQTLEALAVEQGVKRGKGTCEAKLQYGAGWAARMPTEFPVYPKGRVREAGGVEGGICDIRVVSFSTSASMQSVADYYYTRAKRSGFTADYEIRDGEHVLGGTRDNDGGAYVVTLNAMSGGGTSVEIVANNGR